MKDFEKKVCRLSEASHKGILTSKIRKVLAHHNLPNLNIRKSGRKLRKIKKGGRNEGRVIKFAVAAENLDFS